MLDANNGVKITEGSYKNNLRDGKWTSFRPDESIFSEGNYKDGVFDGTWKFWYANGQLLKQVNYIDVCR